VLDNNQLSEDKYCTTKDAAIDESHIILYREMGEDRKREGGTVCQPIWHTPPLLTPTRDAPVAEVLQTSDAMSKNEVALPDLSVSEKVKI
jgi:hypothetical protein